MHRREFIKLSSLTAAWFATNSTVARALASQTIEGDAILIYKMVHYKKGIQVCATMYGDSVLNKRKVTGGWYRQVVDPSKYDTSTFEILAKVPENQANATKWKYWQELGCKGQYVPYDKKHLQKAGAMVKDSPGYQAYLQSEKRKEDLKRSGKKGAEASIKVLEEKHGSIHEHMRYMTSKMTPEARAIAIAKTIHNNKTLPKTQKQIEATRAIGKKYGGRNPEVLKSFTPEQKRLYASMGGKAGGAKKTLANGTHNFITQSPNKIYMLCPDGHITTKPSIFEYCRNRGLDPLQCQELTPQQLASMREDKPKRKYVHSKGISHKAKLTPDDVRQIRGPLRHMKSEEVAKMFGISNTACKMVRSGKTYKDIV